jgi:hypothetical protein
LKIVYKMRHVREHQFVVVVVALALLAATIWAIARSKTPMKELN